MNGTVLVNNIAVITTSEDIYQVLNDAVNYCKEARYGQADIRHLPEEEWLESALHDLSKYNLLENHNYVLTADTFDELEKKFNELKVEAK